MADNSNRRVTITTEEDLKKKKSIKKVAKKKAEKETGKDALVGQPCPLCGKGHIIKGKNAYGCSEWKNGCTWRQPFDTQ